MSAPLVPPAPFSSVVASVACAPTIAAQAALNPNNVASVVHDAQDFTSLITFVRPFNASRPCYAIAAFTVPDRPPPAVTTTVVDYDLQLVVNEAGNVTAAFISWSSRAANGTATPAFPTGFTFAAFDVGNSTVPPLNNP